MPKYNYIHLWHVCICPLCVFYLIVCLLTSVCILYNCCIIELFSLFFSSQILSLFTYADSTFYIFLLVVIVFSLGRILFSLLSIIIC